MRGFRGSRAAMNFKTAHWGKQQQQYQFKVIQGGFNSQQNVQQRELPEWLRIKEAELVPEPAVKAKKPALRVAKPAGKTTAKGRVTKRASASKSIKKRKAA